MSHPSIAAQGRPVRRLLAFSAAAATVASSLLVATASSASAASADYSFLAKVNASRSDHGLRPLTMVSDLHSLATRWAAYQAAGKCGGGEQICHNPHLASDVSNWRIVGENVGVGPSVSDIETAFMQSPEHRANILDPEYTEIGIGTATGKDGRLYVTQDFRAPMHTTSRPSHHRKHVTHPRRHHVAAPPVTVQAHPVRRHAHPVNSLFARLRRVTHHGARQVDPVHFAVTFVSTMQTLAG